jgi:hypothetical protein
MGDVHFFKNKLSFLKSVTTLIVLYQFFLGSKIYGMHINRVPFYSVFFIWFVFFGPRNQGQGHYEGKKSYGGFIRIDSSKIIYSLTIKTI